MLEPFDVAWLITRAKPSKHWITRTLAAVRHASTAPDVLNRIFAAAFELADSNILGMPRV